MKRSLISIDSKLFGQIKSTWILIGSDVVQHVLSELHSADCETWRGRMLIPSCTSAEGVWFKHSTVNASLQTQLLNKNMTPRVKKLARKVIFQHDNDAKHSAKIKQAFLRRKKWKLWPDNFLWLESNKTSFKYSKVENSNTSTARERLSTHLYTADLIRAQVD